MSYIDIVSFSEYQYSLNDLLAKLKAMYGDEEVYHTGQATYLRWGAGGRWQEQSSLFNSAPCFVLEQMFI